MPFDTFLLSNDPAIRLGFFLGMFALMAAWELIAPRRVPGVSKPVRWTHNISIAIINVLLVRVLFPSAAVGVAVFAEEPRARWHSCCPCWRSTLRCIWCT